MLSLVDEPNDTLKFCNIFRRRLSQPGMNIFLDLGAVEGFTSDALLLIRAIMSSPRGFNTQVSGNLPENLIVASEFKATGFFDGFDRPPTDLPLPKGLIRHRSSDKVYADLAAELVDFAKDHVKISKESANVCSQTLVEVMTNTHNHAGDRKTARRSQTAALSPKMVCQRLLPRPNCFFQFC